MQYFMHHMLDANASSEQSRTPAQVRAQHIGHFLRWRVCSTQHTKTTDVTYMLQFARAHHTAKGD
jgi:hypothetical protein